MTEEAMTVAADAVSMPDASAPDVQSSAPEQTARSSVEKAFAAIEAGEAVAEQTRERNENGTFKAKTADAPVVDDQTADKVAETVEKPTTFTDAPARFSADAKAAWSTAPEAVRAEVTRAFRELEGGIEQYRQNFEPYRALDQQLKQNGQSFQEVFNHYTGIEKMLAESPIRGLEQICQNMGLSLRDVAAHVMGQPADAQASQQDAVIRELRNELASLKKEIGGVSTTIKSQQEQAVLSKIDQFAASKPRFDELANDIAFFLNSGKTQDLQEAYDLAERLNPAPVVPAAVKEPDPAQTRKGQLSLSGAPSSGSNPQNRKPPASARDALDRAFAQSGL